MSNIILDDVTINEPVDDETALNAIPTADLVAGVQCYVISPGATYVWSGSAWDPIAAGDLTATYVLQIPDSNLPNAQALSDLSTGILASTTGTGVLNIAALGTDYYGPGYVSINLDSGTNNLYMGSDAPLASAGQSNTSYGMEAAVGITSASDSVFIGTNAGTSISSGSYSVYIGSGAGTALTTTTRNVAIGQGALGASTSADSSVAIGTAALSNSNGAHNIAIGVTAMQNASSSQNIAIGENTCASMNAGGGSNVSIGYGAGFSQSAYTDCLFLGFAADAITDSLVNAVAIGANSFVSISDAMCLGNNCSVGINQPAPLGALHVSNVGTAANIIIDPSSIEPGNLSGSGNAYVFGDDFYFNSPAGIVTPVTRTNIMVYQDSIAYTTINAGPVTILPINSVNNATVTRVVLFQGTTVTGANLQLVASAGSLVILTFPAALLFTNTIVTESTATWGAGFFFPLLNSAITLAATGTLTAGNVNIQVEYFLS